jgi:PAS domain S-box-containing protein
VGASAVEITERKRFEERLRQSEERLRIALGGSPIVVYQQDRDLRYTWLYNSLTAPVEQVLGKTDAQLLPIDEAAALIAIKRRVLETGVVERAEIRATPSKKTSYFDLTVEPMRDESGAIVGVTGSGVDISDRKEREERIAKLQELTAALASAVDADAVARAIVDHGVDAVGANLGIVAVVSGDGRTLVTRAMVGFESDAAETRRRIPLDDPTAITDAVRRREPIYLESWQERIDRYPAASAYHARCGDGAAVTLPLLVEGKPIGALGFGFPTDRVFDGEARDFLRALADLCAQALERARLYDAERQARDAAQEAERRLALLVEISDHLAASLDYEDTVARVARLVVPVLADWCAVNLGSPGDVPQLVALAAADPAEEARLKAFAVEAPVPSGAEGGVAQVLRTGQAVFLPTVLPSDAADTGDPEAGARSRTLDLSSYLCVPLIARGRVRGSLTFAMSWSGRHYREDDLALAEEIARRAAAAIDNAGLFQAAQQEIAERELTIHQVVDVVLERAVPAVGAQGGTVNLLTPTGDAFEIAGSAGMPHRLVEGWRRYPVVGPFPLSDAAKTAEPVWIEQPDDWLTRYPESFDDFMASGFHALASVPLTIEGRLIGGLGYDFTQPRRFTPDDRAFIIALSQQVAQALDRARLYEAEREARSGAQAAEARYRGLFERSADAVLVVDQQGRFQDANPAALELLRYDPDELRGLTLAELAGRDTSWVESVFDNLAREGTWHRELDLRRKDGELVPIEARATAIQTPAGAAAMIAARDISSRRLLERMQQDFFASISHDLKNPLAALRGQVQLLQRRLSRKGILEVSEAESGLETIQNVGERMTGMIEELVDVAQLRGGNPLRLRRQPTDLVAIAARRVREHQQATTRHRIEFDAAEATFSGWWDEARLGRVIDNLLTNAVKYSLGGVISVRLVRDARADGDWVVMTVADNGVGIPSADLPRIFERFRRGSNVLDRFAGTGLGLSGVREIVVQHGGDVSIASAEGVGTTVTVSLPMGEPRDAEI